MTITQPGGEGKKPWNGPRFGVVSVPGLSSYMTLEQLFSTLTSSFLYSKRNKLRLHLPHLSHGAIVKTQRNVWKCSDKKMHCVNEWQSSILECFEVFGGQG